MLFGFLGLAIWLRSSLLATVGFFPLFNEIRTRIENRKLRLQNFNELPLSHPLYSLLDWNDFGEKLRIYVSNTPGTFSELIKISGSQIYIDNKLFGEMDMETIAWIAKMQGNFVRKSKFSLLWIFVIVFGFGMSLSPLFLILKSPIVAVLASVPGIIITLSSSYMMYQSFKKATIQAHPGDAEISIGIKAIDQYQAFHKKNIFKNNISFLSFPSDRMFQNCLKEAKTKALERKSD